MEKTNKVWKPHKESRIVWEQKRKTDNTILFTLINIKDSFIIVSHFWQNGVKYLNINEIINNNNKSDNKVKERERIKQ